MKTNCLYFLGVGLLFVGNISFAKNEKSLTEEAERKVEICHLSGDRFDLITINESAVESHKAHGDKMVESGICPKVVHALAVKIETEISTTPVSVGLSKVQSHEESNDFEIGEKTNEKKITICHNTGSKSNPVVKIDVSGNAWRGHERHGDVISTNGTCEATNKEIGGLGGGVTTTPAEAKVAVAPQEVPKVNAITESTLPSAGAMSLAISSLVSAVLAGFVVKKKFFA